GAFLLDVNHKAAVAGREIEIGVGGVEDSAAVGNGVARSGLGKTFEALAGGVQLVQFKNQIAGQRIDLIGRALDLGAQAEQAADGAGGDIERAVVGFDEQFRNQLIAAAFNGKSNAAIGVAQHERIGADQD